MKNKIISDSQPDDVDKSIKAISKYSCIIISNNT